MEIAPPMIGIGGGATHPMPTNIIHNAIASGKLPAVKAYVRDGGDLDARDALKRTPLHVAAEKQKTAIIALLLANGADPNAANTSTLGLRCTSTFALSAGVTSARRRRRAPSAAPRSRPNLPRISRGTR